MSQSDPIGDVTGPEITEEKVVERIDDWLRRLGDLYEQIKTWAAAQGWSAENGSTMPMHEELMRQFGVPAREQRTLVIRDPQGAEIWVRPKGLWVIGANGRVDIYSRKGAFVLVDIADAFKAPQWVLHRVGKREGQKFSPEQLAEMT
jgi:hypothetical protein